MLILIFLISKNEVLAIANTLIEINLDQIEILHIHCTGLLGHKLLLEILMKILFVAFLKLKRLYFFQKSHLQLNVFIS